MPQRFQVEAGGPRLAESFVDELATLYARDFVEPPLKDTEFFSEERFREKLLAEYVKAPNFKIVIVRNDDHLLGFVYGCSLPPGTQWWQDVREPLPDGFAEETGQRTLALLDIVVKKEWRGQGIATLLHNELLEDRSELRLTLLSSPPQQPAYSIFQHWGYQKIGSAEPEDDGTVMHVFVYDRNKS